MIDDSGLLMPARTSEVARRGFAVAMTLNSVGNGLFFPLSVLYFTRIIGLSVGFLGACMSLAAVVGLVSGLAFGKLSDRSSPQRLFVALMVLQGATVSLYAVLHDPWLLATAMCFATACERGAAAVRGTVIARIAERAVRVRFRARLRALTNAGISAGVGLGSLVLLADSAEGYRLAVLGNAATYLVAAALVVRLKMNNERVDFPGRQQAAPSLRPEKSGALRDKPFLIVSALNAVLLLHDGIISVGVPLWVSTQTDFPLWIVSVLVAVNTLGVIALQVRVSSMATDLPSAGRVARKSALFLGLTCVCIGLCGVVPVWIGVVVLAVGGVFHLCGELLQATAGWTFSFDMARESEIGEYQGVFNSGMDLGSMIAPAVFALLVGLAMPGLWGLLGLVFVCTGLLFGPATRYAVRTRPFSS